MSEAAVNVARPTPLHGLIQALDDQRLSLLGDLDALSEEALKTRPRPEAWSILEILEHLVVAEAVILRGLPPRAGLVAQPRNLGHRLKYLLVSLVLRFRIPVKVPSRRMLPMGQASLADLRTAWDAHLAWLRALVAEDETAALGSAFFTHPVAGPITLRQALRMDLLHLDIHRRQIARLRQQAG